MKSPKKTVLVFGTFDLLHDGHRYFLREAKKLGDELIVAVAPDATVLRIKGHLPEYQLARRIENLESEKLADAVVAGNEEIRSWKVILDLKPDVVAIGYDQTRLAEALQNFLAKSDCKFEIVIIAPYLDGSIHSSTLRKI